MKKRGERDKRRERKRKIGMGRGMENKGMRKVEKKKSEEEEMTVHEWRKR